MHMCIYLCLWVKLCVRMFIVSFPWKHTCIYMHMLSIWVLFFPFLCCIFSIQMYGKIRSRVTQKAEIGESGSWTDCDRDFKVVCEMLASFLKKLFLLFFYPAGESSRRRLFLPCVVSLEKSNVIFCHAESLVTCQREWERNKDRIKTERALTQRLLSLTHFCEH